MTTTPPTVRFPIPRSTLVVAGDPTTWFLTSLTVGPPSWVTTGDPVALEVVKPVAGTLLLAPSRAGSCVLTPIQGAGDGWVPCVELAAPCLHLPTPDGTTATSPGYPLTGSGTNLAALQQSILTAMSDGKQLTVDVDNDSTRSIVVISGATVPFVVLATAKG
jgi:hypothetical protein